MFRISFALGGIVLGLWLAAQTASELSLEALVRDSRYAGAVARISMERDSARRQEAWEHYAALCIEQTEKSYDIGNYERAVALLDSALVALRGTEGSRSAAAAHLWSWKAAAHRQLEQYTEVLDAYNAAIGLYEQLGENGPHVAYCYKNAAQVFIRRQDYRSAEQYLQAALRSDSSGYYRLSIYAQLANNAYWRDSIDAALRYSMAGMNLSGPAEARASLLSTAAHVYRRLGQWSKARQLLEQALTYYRSRPDEAENTIRCLSSLAYIAAHTGNPNRAHALYREAEAVGVRHLQRSYSREMAKLYCEWGDWAMQYRNTQTALLLYQKALQQVFPGFKSDALSDNPSLKKAPVELWAMNAAARKGQALLQGVPTLSHRESAAQCFLLALTVAEQLRNTYGTDEARLYFTEHNFDLWRAAVRNQWALYQLSPQPTYLEGLFELLERGRAAALRDALYRQRALALSGVPDALLQKEEALRRERAATQAALLHAESLADSTSIGRLSTVLFHLERRYTEVLRQLQDYPRYREYLQAGRRISLGEVQQALPDTTALLLFFDTGDSYVTLGVTRQRLRVWQVLRDTVLDAAVAYLCRVLPDKRALEAAPERFFACAYFLRRHLLPDSLLANYRALIMAPDGMLAYVPFEALLLSAHVGPYQTAPYLIRTHTVRYTWSASFVAEERSTHQSALSPLFHAAPFSSASRRGMSTLPNSLDECPKDIEPFTLVDQQATSDAFLRAAGHYQVLHLSTHAHANREGTTCIEFFDRPLTLPEIYAQRLNAALVCLSACQTNTGVFAQGEGILSLARAFAYAGASSLVASGWAVNDRSTARLFASFYRYLQQGFSTAAALRQAQLAMLEAPEPDARKSPYYWAAFTLTGADRTIDLEHKGTRGKWIAIAAIASAVVLWAMLRTRRRRANRRVEKNKLKRNRSV